MAARGAGKSAAITSIASARATTPRLAATSRAQACSRSRTQHLVSPVNTHLVQSDAFAEARWLAVVRCLAFNPVRAGLARA